MVINIPYTIEKPDFRRISVGDVLTDKSQKWDKKLLTPKFYWSDNQFNILSWFKNMI